MATRTNSVDTPDFLAALGGTISGTGDSLQFQQYRSRFITNLNESAKAVDLLNVTSGCGCSFGGPAIGASNGDLFLQIDTGATGKVIWGGSGDYFYLQAGAGGIVYQIECRPTGNGRMVLGSIPTTQNNLVIDSGTLIANSNALVGTIRQSGGSSLIDYSASSLTDVYVMGGIMRLRRNWTGALYIGEGATVIIDDLRVVPGGTGGVVQRGGRLVYAGGATWTNHEFMAGILDLSQCPQPFTVTTAIETAAAKILTSPTALRTVSGLTTYGGGARTGTAGGIGLPVP